MNCKFLDRFDFSRVPFRTVKKHADQFLRDANEAYRLLDLKKEGEITKILKQRGLETAPIRGGQTSNHDLIQFQQKHY